MRKRHFEAFDVFVDAVIFITLSSTLYPFLNVVSLSMSSNRAVLLHPFMIFPEEINFSAYKLVFGNPLLYTSYLNTIFVTVVASALGIFLTLMAAYALARRDLIGRKFFITLVLVTMFIGGSGQMIPRFILIQRLHLYNSLWSLIIPGCLSAFNVILIINFLMDDSIRSLIESASIDGASEPAILFQVVAPVSKAVIATILLFYMVGHWNAFFSAMLYISDRNKWPLQLFLKDMITSVSSSNQSNDVIIDYIPMANIRTAALVITAVPILCVYPFLQKYFVKGVMIGAVKG